MRQSASTLVLDAADTDLDDARTQHWRNDGGAALDSAHHGGRVVHEARLRIELGLRRPELLDVLDDLTAGITIVPVAALEPLLSRCETALREAVASRNGSTRDACVLALAWSVEGDIWTTIATSPEPASPLGRRPISCVGSPRPRTRSFDPRTVAALRARRGVASCLD